MFKESFFNKFILQLNVGLKNRPDFQYQPNHFSEKCYFFFKNNST